MSSCSILITWLGFLILYQRFLCRNKALRHVPVTFLGQWCFSLGCLREGQGSCYADYGKRMYRWADTSKQLIDECVDVLGLTCLLFLIQHFNRFSYLCWQRRK